jgi:hypothetical protein
MHEGNTVREEVKEVLYAAKTRILGAIAKIPNLTTTTWSERETSKTTWLAHGGQSCGTMSLDRPDEFKPSFYNEIITVEAKDRTITEFLWWEAEMGGSSTAGLRWNCPQWEIAWHGGLTGGWEGWLWRFHKNKHWKKVPISS